MGSRLARCERLPRRQGAARGEARKFSPPMHADARGWDRGHRGGAGHQVRSDGFRCERACRTTPHQRASAANFPACFAACRTAQPRGGAARHKRGVLGGVQLVGGPPRLAGSMPGAVMMLRAVVQVYGVLACAKRTVAPAAGFRPVERLACMARHRVVERGSSRRMGCCRRDRACGWLAAVRPRGFCPPLPVRCLRHGCRRARPAGRGVGAWGGSPLGFTAWHGVLPPRCVRRLLRSAGGTHGWLVAGGFRHGDRGGGRGKEGMAASVVIGIPGGRRCGETFDHTAC
jgi:hypothetical protein